MSIHHQYPEEVKQNLIIKAVARYEFYCPQCNRRIKINGIRKYTGQVRYFAFRKCACGYNPEPEVLG